jgi:hypothetical protein
VKKFIIFAVALFVLGLAGSAFAIPAEIPADTTAAIAKGGTQVTIGGELRVRGSVRQNVGDFDRLVAKSGTTAFGKSEHMLYDSRYRLSVEAKVSPNTIGFIQLEAADSASNGNTGENSTWGASGTVSRPLGGSFRFGDQKQNEMKVIQAWMQHSGSGLFGVPSYIKIGHQPIVIGAGVFYSHNLQNDDAIVAGISPIKGLDLSVLTVKLQENANNAADDQDLYSFIANYQINKDISVGLDVSYLDSQNGSAWGSSLSGAAYTSAAWSRLWNFGFNAKANVAGFKLYGTADFQTGRDNVPPHWTYTGFAITGGGSYRFAPVTLSLDLGYGSGDSRNDTKASTFLTSQSDVVHYTFVYDYMVANAAGNTAGGIQNTMFAKFGASVDAMKGLNLSPSITFLNAAKKGFGGGYPFGNGGTTSSFGTINPNAASSKYIGTEVDMMLTYQIDKGLKYFVESGYLFAGNFYKNATYSTRNNGADKFSDPWCFRHGIQLNF